MKLTVDEVSWAELGRQPGLSLSDARDGQRRQPTVAADGDHPQRPDLGGRVRPDEQQHRDEDGTVPHCDVATAQSRQDMLDDVAGGVERHSGEADIAAWPSQLDAS